MKFETTDDRSTADHHAHRIMSATGPYATRQARTDVADTYAQCDRSYRPGVMEEANLAYLQNACEQAGVRVGAYDARILAWLGGWEPETCAVIAGLIARAHTARSEAGGTADPLLDPYCQAGLHAVCLGRLCQCPECQHRLEQP
jgi:hypothetical protein